MRLRPGPAAWCWLLLLTADDGDWSAWSANYTSCSCGVGYWTRSRTCDNPLPRNNGSLCRGPLWDIQPCCRGVFDCDFQTDMCGWTQDFEDDFDWTRHEGSPVCPDGYVYHQLSGLCYKAFNVRTTYNGAVSRCSSDGGSLAVPRDDATNEFLIDLKNTVDNNAFFRFGLTDHQQEGVWMWDDNVPLGDFRGWPWGTGEPNNQGNEDCAEYIRDSSSKSNLWNDGPCNRADRKFICQVSPSVGIDRYMYIEAAGQVAGDRARLYSPTVTTACTQYLRFCYHVYGTNNTLNVYVRADTSPPTDPVFTGTGGYGNQWLKAEVEIGTTGSYHVVMEAIRGTGFEGDIALDNITMATGHCTTGACRSRPCKNYGTCVEDTSTATGYICLCMNGWEGGNCTQDVDECQSSPCGPGTCHDRLNGYLCLCPWGYNGNNCEKSDLPVNCSKLAVCEHTVPESENTIDSCRVEASMVEGIRGE
ncbi:MAM and LDL-receptor class A domain-containing protein 1-like [Branchiostoma floridae x Branchiostoma belcheri]